MIWDVAKILVGLTAFCWFCPRVLWTYRYTDALTVPLMVIIPTIYVGFIGIVAVADLQSGVDGVGGSMFALSDGWQGVLYWAAVGAAATVSAVSSVLYARHLRRGGDTFLSSALRNLGVLCGRVLVLFGVKREDAKKRYSEGKG